MSLHNDALQHSTTTLLCYYRTGPGCCDEQLFSYSKINKPKTNTINNTKVNKTKMVTTTEQEEEEEEGNDDDNLRFIEQQQERVGQAPDGGETDLYSAISCFIDDNRPLFLTDSFDGNDASVAVIEDGELKFDKIAEEAKRIATEHGIKFSVALSESLAKLLLQLSNELQEVYKDPVILDAAISNVKQLCERHELDRPHLKQSLLSSELGEEWLVSLQVLWRLTMEDTFGLFDFRDYVSSLSIPQSITFSRQLRDLAHRSLRDSDSSLPLASKKSPSLLSQFYDFVKTLVSMQRERFSFSSLLLLST